MANATNDEVTKRIDELKAELPALVEAYQACEREAGEAERKAATAAANLGESAAAICAVLGWWTPAASLAAGSAGFLGGLPLGALARGRRGAP